MIISTAKTKDLILETMLKCPHCGVEQRATMPVSGMKMAQDCRFCNETILAKEGSHCVFCSYGLIKCPHAQQKDHENERPAINSHR